MTTQRKRPATQKTAARRPTHKNAAKGKKQRAFTVQNPVQFRSPVVRNKRRPKRKTTITVGSVLVAVVTVTAYIVVGVVAAVVTGLITGVATGIAAARSQPDPPQQQAKPGTQQAGKAGGGSTPGTGKQPTAGSVVCGAPTRSKGWCSRFTSPGQNCGIPGHPPPAATQGPTP